MVNPSGPGALVLVATPIGNLGDLSGRASQELSTADIIACEDTRRTGRLLSLAGIGRRPLLRLDDHTETARAAEVVTRIERGERVVLVSDAGMPAISDPGERLVHAVAAAGLTIEVVPGPSAVVTALAGSGLPTQRFCFEGFLPRRPGERASRLAVLADEARTMVFYESPHRLAATLADLATAFGVDRPVVVARELTKLHEQWWRGPAAAAATWASEESPRGELVIVVEGAPPAPQPTAGDLEAMVVAALARGGSVKEVATEVAAGHGVSRREVYALAVRLAAASRRPGGVPVEGGRDDGHH